MKTLLLFASIALASGLLFTNIYTSLIDAKSWGSQLPGSIATSREYFRVVNPGHFFRIFSPLNQILALVVLLLFWKTAPSARLWLGLALVLYVATDALTFGYFYPRNDIMFRTAALTDTELLKRTIQEWSSMNWLRSAVLAAGIIAAFKGLDKIYAPELMRV